MQGAGWIRSGKVRSFILHPALLIILASASTALGQERLRLATTTSVQDSGLMPYLLPVFEKECRCKVDVIAVGSGQALKLASNGDVDMVIVHEPAAEKNSWKTGGESTTGHS